MSTAPLSLLQRLQPGAYGRRLRFLPWFLLVAGLITTGAMWWNVRHEGSAVLQREFESESTALIRIIESRLQTTGDLLGGVAGLFSASPGLDRNGFLAYTTARDLESRHPGLLGIGFAIPVAAGDTEAHTQAMQASGLSGYALHPQVAQPLHGAVTHAASAGLNTSQALGFDLMSEPVLQKAMLEARDQGGITLSGHLPLHLDNSKDEPGFLIFAPAFRQGGGKTSAERRGDLIGWAFARLSARAVSADALRQAFGNETPRLRMRLHDGRQPAAEQLLFDSAPDEAQDPDTRFHAIRLLEYGGRTWALELEARRAFTADILHPAGGRILAAGILLSVVLAILARILVSSHHRVTEALAQTAHANQDLQESKRRFRILANSVPVLIWVSDATGARNWFSQQWVDFTGCDPNTRAPYKWSDFIHPEDRRRSLKCIVEACEDKESFSIEYRLANIDGSFHWVMDSATPRFNERGDLAGYIGSCVDIHDRKMAEAGLHEREALLRSIYDASSAAIFLVDMKGRITHANHRMSEIFGRAMDDLIGSDYITLIAPPERESAGRKLGALLAREMPSVNLERVYYRQDQTLFWGLLTGRPLRDGKGNICGLVGVIADVTARKEAEAGMALAARVFEACHEGIFMTDAQCRIISVNPAFTAISGYPANEALGKEHNFLASKRHPEAFFAALEQSLATTDHWEGEVWNRHRDGRIYPAWLAMTRIASSNGQTSNYVAIFTDISERKKSEAKMHHLAHYDYLTDLPNRALLIERMTLIHSTARRYSKGFAVLFADLDLFKQVNDDYGHNTGDALLIEVAQRLRAITRDSDTVSRQGGDEFVILAPEIHEPVRLLELAEKLRNAISRPYEIQGHRLAVAVSIGIAIFPRDGDTVDDIMRAADSAMYRAKNAGHNKIRFANGDRNGRPEDKEEPARPLYVVGGSSGQKNSA